MKKTWKKTDIISDVFWLVVCGFFERKTGSRNTQAIRKGFTFIPDNSK